jgi:MFS family permease
MSLINEPQNPGWWQIVWKTFIWLLIGGILSFLVFAIMSVLWTDFFTKSEGMFMSLVFIIIACIVTIIGVGIFAGLLNLMFGSDYYDFAKMFGFSVLANGLLVFLFLPVYLMMSDSLDVLLFVLAFHVMFAFFISYTLIEFTTNPSYSASSLIWSVLGFGITLMIYMVIYNMTKWDVDWTNTLNLSVLSPFLISYTVIPLCHGIRTQIYYGIYTGGSNPLFVPQLADVTQTQEEVDEVTVEVPQS